MSTVTSLRILQNQRKSLQIQILNFQQFQYQMTSLKPVGTIKITQPRSIGKLYQTPRQTVAPQSNTRHQPTHRIDQTSSAVPKRGDSVGKIYTTKRSCSREPVNPSIAIKKSIIGRTGKDEMQDKLVEQIFAARTLQKVRYNYLAQPYQPIAKNIIKNGVRLQEKGLKERDGNQQILVKVEPEKRPGKLRLPSTEDLMLEKNKEIANESKQNCTTLAVMKKRDVKSSMGVISKRDQTCKDDLGARVKEMIMHYETKNRQHSLELQKLQLPTKDSLISTIIHSTAKEDDQISKQQAVIVKTVSLKESMCNLFSKLVESNLKSVCLSLQSDEKLQQLWKSVHHQIILDQKLRIFRYFINQQNKEAVVTLINENRIKKIDNSIFQIHTEEYDPFLIEKINEMTTELKISTKESEYLEWVAENFMKSYEESEKSWLKHFSQETMSSTINTYELSRETIHPKEPSQTQQSTIRDYTRLLSTLFKSNLRNRNIYQMYTKLKGMAYAGRFLQLLSLKSGESGETKKFASSNK